MNDLVGLSWAYKLEILGPINTFGNVGLRPNNSKPSNRMSEFVMNALSRTNVFFF